MKRCGTITHAIKLAALACWCWAMQYAPALAQGNKPPAEPESTSGASNAYALPYALVIFCVILGLLVVLHASHRREREAPEQYESKEMLKEE